jgi:D-arabinose 1-dehydrogenase-like Zn-dependent alcohol dehydrogenase
MLMKLRVLLFILYQKLKRAAKKNVAYRSFLGRMQVKIMIKTADGKHGRLFIFDKGKLSTLAGERILVCGSDINLLFLKDSPTASPFTSFPCVPGHEICGEIVETGSAVEDCHTGDLVAILPSLNCYTRAIKPICRSCAAGATANCENFAEGAFSPGMFIGICKDINGGFAEYCVAHKSQVYRVPAGVSPESATLVEPPAVGLQAVPPDAAWRAHHGDRVHHLGRRKR